MVKDAPREENSDMVKGSVKETLRENDRYK